MTGYIGTLQGGRECHPTMITTSPAKVQGPRGPAITQGVETGTLRDYKSLVPRPMLQGSPKSRGLHETLTSLARAGFFCKMILIEFKKEARYFVRLLF